MSNIVLRSTAVVAALVTAFGVAAMRAQRPDAFSAPFDHPAIQYTNSPVDDRIARLDRDIQAGRVKLAFDKASGYLPSVLDALHVARDSQTLVFSETSAQAELLSVRNPRALFFDDSVFVGWVRGADELELAAQDPKQGVIFYTLKQKPADVPELTREKSCLLCHLSWDTLAVPGLLTISTFPMSDDPNAYATGVVTDHRTPLAQRWGGWYVTGAAVPARHLGNVPVIQSARQLAKPPGPAPKLASVDGQIDMAGFLSHSSDVAALMVLNHQTHMTNLFTRLGWEARLAEHNQRTGATGGADRVHDAAYDLVDYMLFVEEAPIASRIQGSSGFTERFSAQGPRDHQGRSLRQLDHERRLMRYPCSYMIYSEAFDALPPAAMDAVYQRMWKILSAQESDKRYARLSLADRQSIVEILRDTKKNLPDYIRAVAH